MADVIIEELWKIKDIIAQEHGYNLDLLVVHLKAQELLAGQKVVTLRAKKAVVQDKKPRNQWQKPCLTSRSSAPAPRSGLVSSSPIGVVRGA
jgi:hypothetical protein